MSNSPTPPKESPWQVLGLPENADEQQVRRAYRDLSLRMHPDKNSSPDASMQFQRIAAAYQTLTDPVERRRFDADRAAAAELQKRQAEPVDLWTMMMQQHQQMHEQQHQLEESQKAAEDGAAGDTPRGAKKN